MRDAYEDNERLLTSFRDNGPGDAGATPPRTGAGRRVRSRKLGVGSATAIGVRRSAFPKRKPDEVSGFKFALPHECSSATVAHEPRRHWAPVTGRGANVVNSTWDRMKGFLLSGGNAGGARRSAAPRAARGERLCTLMDSAVRVASASNLTHAKAPKPCAPNWKPLGSLVWFSETPAVRGSIYRPTAVTLPRRAGAATISWHGPDQEGGNFSGPGQPILRPKMAAECSEQQLEKLTGAQRQLQI
jgi:hypothetical protein